MPSLQSCLLVDVFLTVYDVTVLIELRDKITDLNLAIVVKFPFQGIEYRFSRYSALELGVVN
jgi:hypothetical protein